MSSGTGALEQADQRARSEAQQEFARPVVLEAGAGTGKTTVLVARIVAWCTGLGWERAAARLEKAASAGRAPAPDEIAADLLRRVVAITFTEAAAAEMAGRVGASLLELEAGRLPEGSLEEALPPDAGLRAERARALVASLDQLGVRTIHAWCRRLLAAQPLEAGLHPRFEVDADGRRSREVIRDVLERRLVEAYEGVGDPDHLALARDNIGPHEIEEALVALVEAGLPARALEASPFDPDSLARLHDEVRVAFGAFQAAEAGALSGVRKAPKAAQTADLVDDSAAAWSERAPASAAQLAERCAELRSQWDKPVRDRLRKWARAEFGKAEGEALGENAPALAAAAEPLGRLLSHLLAIAPEALDRARRVLQPLLAETEQELRRRGVESFEALLRDTRRLLVDEPGAARRVRAEIDQLLVDEFQDTDRIQCGILSALVLDAPRSEPRLGLFLVGDPKQSIYGWRNADLAAYDDFTRRVEEQGGVFHRLAVNFRSVKPVLDEVDRCIAAVMHRVPRLQPGYEPLVACDDLASAPGYDRAGRAAVEHWVSWGWDAAAGEPQPGLRSQDAAELEARALAEEIARLHREEGLAWDDVGLLFRGLGDVEIYLGALREAGVPTVVERDESYYQRREVIEASSLLRCILDPRDHVALLALLRSAWVGVPDAALLPLWRHDFPEHVSALRGGRGPGSTESEALEPARRAVRAAAAELAAEAQDPERAAALGLDRLPGWQDSLLAAVEALDCLRGAQRRRTPEDFVELARALFAPEPSESGRYLGLHRLANLDRFFRDLVAALEESGGDVGAVLTRLRTVSAAREAEEGRPCDAADDAVHLLSIHKAKGLAFQHVYLLQTHKAGRERQVPVRAAPRDEGWEYALFGAPTPGFYATARARSAVSEAERVRTLYVAMTRARQRLVLCGRRSPPAGSGRSAPAGSHLQLLETGADRAAVDQAMREAAAAGVDHWDRDGVRWVFPALRPPLEAVSAPVPATESEESWQQELSAVAAAREPARRRQARPFQDVASGHAPGLVAETVLVAEAAAEEEAPVPLSRELSMLVGTAVHAALEGLDPRADPEAERAACGARAASLLSILAPPDQREPAEARLQQLLDRFFAGPLYLRLQELADHRIGCEVPVLLAPEGGEDGPVGFVAGAIDLLYQDPADSRLVVVDYKTDGVSGETRSRRAQAYAEQGRIYTSAVQRALGLAYRPRFELWFLEDGGIVSGEVGPRAGHP